MAKKQKTPERRDFLKTAGGAALAAGMLPSILSAGAQEVGSARLTRPITPTLVKSQSTKDGSNDVITMELDLTAAHGAKHAVIPTARESEPKLTITFSPSQKRMPSRRLPMRNPPKAAFG